MAQITIQGEQQVQQSGTKHFSPGTKVYCLAPQWGDGYENIKVIGRHRGSKQFVTIVAPARHITHWRLKVVYNPEILRRMAEHGMYQWKGREHVEEMVVVLQTRERLGKKCTAGNIEAALREYRNRNKPWWRFW